MSLFAIFRFSFLGLLVFSSVKLSAGTCTAIDPVSPGFYGASLQTSSVTSSAWDDSQKVVYPGSQLTGDFGEQNASDRVYFGPARSGNLSLGPHLRFVGTEKVVLNSSIEFSTDWSPSGREVCGNHKYRLTGERECVEKHVELDETSFTIVLSHKENDIDDTPIYSQTYRNLNHISHRLIQFPQIECQGSLDDFEVRVQNLVGGSVRFVIHNITIDARWRSAQ